MTGIQVGDVCLDLTQGRPVHVLEDTGETAAEWSERNDYELVENYGNSRLDAAPEDRVFDVVYCSSVKSEPSKTYAMPESRLLRVETEAADDGRLVYERVLQDVLETLLLASRYAGTHEYNWLHERAAAVADWDQDLVDEAAELAEVAYREDVDNGTRENYPLDWDRGDDDPGEDAVTMEDYVGDEDA